MSLLGYRFGMRHSRLEESRCVEVAGLPAVERTDKRTTGETEHVGGVIMMELEKLKRKIEEGGQLYIPNYVYTRVEDCIRNLENGCSDTDINEAWRELKENYGRISGGDRSANLYRSLDHIIAYLRYYFFLNYPAIKWILLNCLEKDMEIIPRKDTVKVLDYGAGPGTASMAVCDFLEDAGEIGVYENTKVKLFFDEMYGDFSNCYRRMLCEHGKVEGMTYVFDNGQNWYKKNFYDLILISYVLSELSESMQKWLITHVSDCLNSDGHVIIIEPAYKGMRKFIGNLFKDHLIREGFKIVEASGPLCSVESCDKWGECYGKSIKRKELRTPDGMTEEMKGFFEEEKKKRIKWVYAVLKKVPDQEGYVDPSELREYYDAGRENIKLSGWVINKKSTEYAENITFCKGLGCCNLAFWRGREVCRQVRDISEGDILGVEGELLRTPYEGLLSVSVTEIIEHTRRVD